MKQTSLNVDYEAEMDERAMTLMDRLRGFRENEIRTDITIWAHNRTIDCWRSITDNPPSPDSSLETLDEYPERVALQYFLSVFPLETIYARLGSEGVIYRIVNGPIDEEEEEAFRAQFLNLTGKDVCKISDARLWVWRENFSHNIPLVMKVHDLHAHMLESVSDPDYLPQLLEQSTLPGVSLSAERIRDYKLMQLSTKERNSRGYARDLEPGQTGRNDNGLIYLDSPLALALQYKGKPNAVVGFFPKTADDLVIFQMQGIRPAQLDHKGLKTFHGSSRGLAPFDWQKLFVQVVEDIGKAFGYSRIGIRSGHKNPWTEPDRFRVIHLPLEDALRKYDTVAQRLGFAQAQDTNWYRSLTPGAESR